MILIVYEIKTEDIFKGINEIKEYFDFSDYKKIIFYIMN